MTTTATPRTATCKGCYATLTAKRTVQRGWGDVCWRKEQARLVEDARIAAIEAAAGAIDLSSFADPTTIRDKAIQLLIDRALTPTRAPGLYIATSSDGESTYLVDVIEHTCTCKAGLRLGRCNHLAAGQVAELIDVRPASLILAA